MPFTGDTFTKLFEWRNDPQRNENIFNSRLDDEFGGIATGLTEVATDIAAINTGSSFLSGLTLSNNGSDPTNDIDIAAGSCVGSILGTVISLSAITKRLDANWAAGTNQGFRNSAAAITNTTYHVYAACKADGADPDAYAHTSATASTALTALQAETGGSAYVDLRLIGSIIRAGTTPAIVLFTMMGTGRERYVRLKTPPLDINVSNLGTTSISYGLTVPDGRRVLALGNAFYNHAASNRVYIRCPDDTDTAPSNSAAPLSTIQNPVAGIGQPGQVLVGTNTSRQIAVRAFAASSTFRWATLGWWDFV